MIITKEVYVVLGGQNVKHFENLGYEIPKVKGKWGYTTPRGTEILVKVEDLPKTSSALIQCCCEKCLSKNRKEIITCTYDFFNIKKNKNEDILCDNCKKEIASERFKNSEYNINRINNSKIKKETYKQSQQFKKEKERLDYLTEVRKVALEIGLISDFKNEEYINSKQKLTFICPIHGKIHKTANQIMGRYKCKYCASDEVHEKQRYNLEYVKEKYLENGFVLLEDTYLNSSKPNKCYCIKHPDIIQYKCFRMILQNRICFYCQHEMQQNEGHPSWKGGTTLLYNYLRTIIEPWKYESSNYYNNKCILTNNYETVVHHLLRSFKSIVDEALDFYNIDLKYTPVSTFDNDTLYSIGEKVLQFHYVSGFGIPIHKKLHKLFHSKELYGNRNNTPEQFEEFKTRLKSGEFNSFLQENKLTLTF